MPVFRCSSRKSCFALAGVIGLSAAPVAAASSVVPLLGPDSISSTPFGGVVQELATPVVGNPAPQASVLADPSGLVGDLGAVSNTFGDRNTAPPIEMLRFTYDLTGSNLAVSDGNSSSYPAIGRTPILDSDERLNPIVAIPLPSGGLLALLGLGLIGTRRIRSVP